MNIENEHDSASLINRIQRRKPGCFRRFDPISKEEVFSFSHVCPSLMELCRKIILQHIPMAQIHQASTMINLPPLLAKNICSLKIDDFIINPLKVDKDDKKNDCYKACAVFSRSEVLLLIKTETLTETPVNLLTSFQDSGYMCYVLDPVISLDKMLNEIKKLNGVQISPLFAWQIISTVTQHILKNVQETNWHLDMNTIKVSTEISKIYMDIQHAGSSPIGHSAPPELGSLQQIIPEKLHIWQLGTLLQEMLPVLSNRLYPRGSENEGCERKVLSTIIQDCLNPNPNLRPSAKTVYKLAKEKLCLHSPNA